MGIITGVGSPGTVASASGGKIYPFNTINETTQTLVAPANPSRTKIIFHNPGSKDVLIIPANTQFTGANVANTVTTSLLGGAFVVFQNGGSLEITGECSGAWYALSVLAGGTGNPLTVMDSNIG